MELDFAAIIGRAQRLILSPSTEWDVIAGEPADVQKIYMNYVGPLVIAAAVASAIGFSLVGIAGFHMPIGSAFTTMILQIVLGLVMVYMLAFVINALAPTFGATQDMGQAFKLAAYAPTASWVAGLLAIVPALGIIGALGSLYTLYLLFVGLPKLMKPPEDKAMTYTLAVIGVMIVIAIILYSVQSSMMPSYTPMMRNY